MPYSRPEQVAILPNHRWLVTNTRFALICSSTSEGLTIITDTGITDYYSLVPVLLRSATSGIMHINPPTGFQIYGTYGICKHAWLISWNSEVFLKLQMIRLINNTLDSERNHRCCMIKDHIDRRFPRCGVPDNPVYTKTNTIEIIKKVHEKKE